jgi:hypothetical protein
MSTEPLATSAPQPEDEPPVECQALRGFCTTPVLAVLLPPDTQKYSQAALPVISTPASSTRVTTGASKSGTKPSRMEEPLAQGMPAMKMTSLMAIVRPASRPDEAPLIDVRTYQALSGFSSGFGK